jgi:hypothetical protein
MGSSTRSMFTICRRAPRGFVTAAAATVRYFGAPARVGGRHSTRAAVQGARLVPDYGDPQSHYLYVDYK